MQAAARDGGTEVHMPGHSLPDSIVFWFNAVLTSAAVASAWVTLILNLDSLV